MQFQWKIVESNLEFSGVSIFPVNSALMSSSKYENRYAEANELKANARTCGGKRRAESVISKTKVAIDMLKRTLSSGINADYVLMDTWFTTEPFIQKINELGLDVICMVKQLRQRYKYNGRLLNLRKLFQVIPNRKRGDIICSAIVKTKRGITENSKFDSTIFH